MNKLIGLIFIILICKYIECQEPLVLTGYIYDQTPQRNPDFEMNPAPNGIREGIVLPTLGADNTPTYCCGDNPVYFGGGTLEVHNQTTFYSWFHEVPNVSLKLPITLTFTYQPATDSYSYINGAFFPIDNEGWDNPDLYPNQVIYNGHNYHFCMEFHSSFTYKGGEYFTFVGDDDVWVFFNKKLLIDLGGLHTSAEKTVNMDAQGYAVGQTVPFDFFYCERHTVASNLNIITNIDLKCPEADIDICGVCYGHADTCCLATGYCDLREHGGNKCKIGSCSPTDNQTCTYQDVDCNDNNTCTVDICLQYVGCIHFGRICTDSDPCTTDSCDPLTGCIHTHVPNCGACATTGCVSVNPCAPNECNPLTNMCEATPKNCTQILAEPNPCVFTYCDPEFGTCEARDICTDIPTVTPTTTPTRTPSTTPSTTPSITPSTTPTGTPTTTPTRTPSVTPTRTPSVTPTRTPSPSVSSTHHHTNHPTPPVRPTNPGIDCSYEETQPPRCLDCTDLLCLDMELTCVYLENPSDSLCPLIPTCVAPQI